MIVLGVSGLDNSVPFRLQHLPGLSEREYRIAQGLDSAAAIVTAEGIYAAAQERFNRNKGSGAFPLDAIRYCLEAAKVTPDQVDYVAHGFSYEPHRHLFERGDEFVRAQFDAVFSDDAFRHSLEEHVPQFGWESKVVHVPHHLAHAASAFYLSGMTEALILVSDGMGEIHSTTVALGKGHDISILTHIPALHSLGLLYGVFTLYLGFDMNCDEYKVMGLAPFGDSRPFFDVIMNLIHLKKDGTYTLPILARNTTVLERETYAGTLRELSVLLGPPREPGETITKRHRDIAAALQAVLQTSLFHILRHFRRETGQRNLCMAGGVALNCTANSAIRRSKLFDQMFVQPASGDDGTSLGAALYIRHLGEPSAPRLRMDAPLWGPEYTKETIAEAIQRHPECQSVYFDDYHELARSVARRLAKGDIVAWFQGKMEFGPRALGNRSILADSRPKDIRERMNHIIKKREEFRPFAPAVPIEVAQQYFEIEAGDEAAYAHMLYVAPVRVEYRTQLSAVTHVDDSARVQVVTSTANWRFWTLLHAFGSLTGVPVLLNTSFNVKGQPIVCSPDEALDTFLSTALDAVVIGDYLVLRKEF